MVPQPLLHTLPSVLLAVPNNRHRRMRQAKRELHACRHHPRLLLCKGEPEKHNQPCSGKPCMLYML